MEQPEIIEIDRGVLSSLIERIEMAIEHDLALSVDDMKLLLSAIITLCTLQSKIEQDDVTLHKLRKLLGMVKQSERRQQSDGSSSASNRSKRNKTGNNTSGQRNTTKAPEVVHHTIQDHHKGDLCPECQCGKLYKFEPATLLRVTGHARYEATRHVVEQMRCNACQMIYKAPLPDEVLADGDANQKYGYSARSLMVIDKFYSGTPYYHQSNLADIFGFQIHASTIFDQCEHVANAVISVFYECQRQAANAKKFLLDDTHNRILTQQPELREKPNGKGQQLRTGVYTSGLIAVDCNGHDIVLFNTSLGHIEILDPQLHLFKINDFGKDVYAIILNESEISKLKVMFIGQIKEDLFSKVVSVSEIQNVSIDPLKFWLSDILDDTKVMESINSKVSKDLVFNFIKESFSGVVGVNYDLESFSFFKEHSGFFIWVA